MNISVQKYTRYLFSIVLVLTAFLLMNRCALSDTDQSFYIAQNVQPVPQNVQPVPQNVQPAPQDSAVSVPAEMPIPPAKSWVSTEKPVEGGIPIGNEVVIPDSSKIAEDAIPDSANVSGQVSGIPPGASPSGSASGVPQTATPGAQAIIPPTGIPQVPATGIPRQQQTPQPQDQQPARKLRIMEEKSIYNVPTANLRTMKVIIDEEFNLVGIVYGEELGYLHVLSADGGGYFKEVWRSPPLNAPVRGVFVEDLQGNGENDIVAYTEKGTIFIYDFEKHNLKYRSSEGTYTSIKTMVVTNIDNTPEKELLFIGIKSGRDEANLIQFDTKSLFEEWVSQETYRATDMVVGNVDNDSDPEIILNTGEILDSRFKDIKWKSDIPFGSRLYLIDLDSDGLLELVTEYDQSYVRVLDIDQRKEKW